MAGMVWTSVAEPLGVGAIEVAQQTLGNGAGLFNRKRQARIHSPF